VRLTGGPDATQGRVELLIGGQWGTVCDTGFTNTEANVACLSAGFNAGQGTFLDNQFGPGTGPIYLDNVVCSGSEYVLDDCAHSAIGATNCTHDQDVSVSCSGTGYTLRLTGASNTYEGRLEILYRNLWGSICDHNFDVRDAQVACNTLGFGHTGYAMGNVFGRGSGEIWLDEVQCNGDESNIGNCVHNPWGVTDCVHFDDISISCTALDVAVRLVGGPSDSEGRFEMFFNGQWGTVCDAGFTNVEAQVACYSLGYNQGVGTFLGNQYGPGFGPVWMDNVQCTGTEDVINECQHSEIGGSNCSHAQDVSISCVGTGYQVRVVDGDFAYQGRLEVNYQGEWGTVCSDNFDARDAQVACASLGLGRVGYSTGSVFGRGDGTIMLDEVNCLGDEDNIGYCQHNPWTMSNCIHAQDVGVSCTALDVAVRLSGGSSPTEGRLEQYFSGIWGTVCDTGFTNVEAQVACYSLGFDQGQGTYLGNQFGPGTGQIWLDNVQCHGNETVINGCNHSPWGEVNNCTHADDVSISCVGTGYGVRLVEGTAPYEGRLEVNYQGEWGTVCADLFDVRDAQVACSSLGFGRTGYSIGSEFGGGEGTIMLDDVECLGDESNIGNCAHLPWTFSNCIHLVDVSISCTTVDVAVRLVGGATESEGRLETYVNGQWGTVCDSGFADVEAQVACYSLGYNQGEGVFLGNQFGPGTGRIWLDNVDCDGTESVLNECQHSQIGTSNCTHDRDVSISCTGTGYPLRLTGGIFPKEGRLEVFYRGEWGTVCDDFFTNLDAQVACYSLGHGRVGRFQGTSEGTGTIWLDDLGCTGSESNIGNCAHQPWGFSNCIHREDVAITCSTSTGINYALRLVGSDGLPAQSSGRLEIYQGANEWGTVCDTEFSDVDAQVACASLGFTQFQGSYIGQTHGEGAGRIWLDNVNCTGNEIMLDDCQHSPWGSSVCNHTNDVSISCAGPWPAMPVRLINPAANTTTPTEGRLEIFYFGIWGTVCDDGFNDINAQVVCNSLGFGYTGQFVFNLYGSGSDQIWLDDVICEGNELSVGTCGHSAWGVSNCDHTQDVSVRCVPI
jgi:deleted-in-malignant-brain-tumors protein 1